MAVDIPDIEAALADLAKHNVIDRIWRSDHTVWKPTPTEISDRLGWLTITKQMRSKIRELHSFADEVRDADYRHVVLLGMGGSSLGPEVLRQTFGSAPEYPEMLVLDSTIPAQVRAIRDAIDLTHALFLVSSKSGSTTETLSSYTYFRNLVEGLIGPGQAGRNFVAITDTGSPLESIAREQGFRRCFLNPADIGGRYSILSYFGLVPAALIGANLLMLLDRADSMRALCSQSVPVKDNPGALLGSTIATMAMNGRDKLTLVSSPSISSLGLWIEQLVAESTGKDGMGIVPVFGEPVREPSSYGNDRLFIYSRIENDNNDSIDTAIDALQSSGQPVVRLELRNKYDLGSEFFRWEFATALVGAMLDLHPFDQPNVQQTKDLTIQVLQEYQKSGQILQVTSEDSFANLLSKAKPGDYLAIMAYLHQTPNVDAALMNLRENVMKRYCIATTLGYGPRFLHSTGQLHKGGPNSGIFLQLTTAHEDKLPIQGKPYTFDVLTDAQAAGDLRALLALNRRVARIHLVPEEIQKLADALA